MEKTCPSTTWRDLGSNFGHRSGKLAEPRHTPYWISIRRQSNMIGYYWDLILPENWAWVSRHKFSQSSDRHLRRWQDLKHCFETLWEHQTPTHRFYEFMSPIEMSRTCAIWTRLSDRYITVISHLKEPMVCTTQQGQYDLLIILRTL
jgi:hypothetical protein